jgi:hypothetical protein
VSLCSSRTPDRARHCLATRSAFAKARAYQKVVWPVGHALSVSWGVLGDRFDAERIESEGRKRLGDQDFEKAFAAGAAAGVEDLTRSS